MMSVKIYAFRPADNPEACERFIEGHRRVLEIYDIKMITSNKEDWLQHKNTYVLVAESLENSKILGGARIQLADGELPLPIEDAVGIVDKNIYSLIESYKKGRTGEVCGLWNSREIAGYGIGSLYLAWSGVALARIAGLSSVFALCAPATVKYSKMIGFEIETMLGNEGFFNYPKLNLVATAMVVKNLKTLDAAEDPVRETIFSLCNNPRQSIIFDSPKGKVRIIYDLDILRSETSH